MRGRVVETQTKEGLAKRQSRALAVLFLYNGLELLSDPQAAAGVVLELQECYERVVKLRSGKSKAAPTKKLQTASTAPGLPSARGWTMLWPAPGAVVAAAAGTHSPSTPWPGSRSTADSKTLP